MTGYMAEYLAGLILFGLTIGNFFGVSPIPVSTKIQMAFAIILLILAFLHISLVV